MSNIMRSIKKRLDGWGNAISEPGLIVFDYKSMALLIVAMLSFVLLVFLKINYSSVDSLYNILGRTDLKHNGLILGKPKAIRSDEWMVVTPFMLSQAKLGFPVQNEALGAGKTPLLMSLPVAHFSTFFRPQNWGFFVLDIERAYAYWWNFKVLGLLVSFFLLLMLVTENNFWISFSGSLLVFFSGFIQWWLSTPAMLPEMITSFCMVFISLAYIFFSKKIYMIYGASLVALIFGINFVLFFYPPFQLPLVYLGLFLFAGFFLKKFDKDAMKKMLPDRLAALGIVVILGVFVLALFYRDAKETIQMVMNTAYPGKRFLTGGTMDVGVIFSGYYNFFWNERNVPRIFGNICEASNFTLFSPFVVLLLAWEIYKEKRIKKEMLVSVFLSAYIMAVFVWMLWGFPHFFAGATLFSMVQPERAIVGLGLASIILVALYLSKRKSAVHSKQAALGVALLAFVAILIVGFHFNRVVGNYYSFVNIFLYSLFGACMVWALVRKKWALFFIPLLLLRIVPNFPINPVVRGLNPIYGNALMKETSAIIHDQHMPNGKWVVFGNFFIANLLKATGADVVNGVNFAPDLNKNHLLDPSGAYAYIYNRYAHIDYEPTSGATVSYTMDHPDGYVVSLNPCSENMKNLEVRYAVFSAQLDTSGWDCLHLLTPKPLNGMNIYTYQW